MIAEVAVNEPPSALLVELDEVAVTQLEHPRAAVPLRGRLVWADGDLEDLIGEHVLLCLDGGTWWDRPGPTLTLVPERGATPAVAGRLRTLR